MMITIRDVAEYAKVSVATVSRVLNNKGQVSEETKRKVRDAIEHLNYRPNLVARTLYKKTSSMIGLILPDITNPFFPALARTVEDQARSYGYTVILCNSDGSPAKEADYIGSLEQKGIDGIIISTTQANADHFKDVHIPIVALDRGLSNEIPTVTSENKNGAREATELLIKSGCQSVVHLQGPRELVTTNDRKKGFLEVVQKVNVEHSVIETEFDIKAAEETAYQILKQQPQIDGIFAGSDSIAIGIIRAAHRLGRRIPEDLQIVGFDGIELGKLFIPSLTTIEQPIYEMGALAVDLLSKQINKQQLDKYLYEFPTKLIIGNTTKKVEEE